MKKALKIIGTILFVAGMAFDIYEMSFGYSDVVLIFFVLAVFAFLFHLLAWIAPKKLAYICWLINRHNPFSNTYDEAVANMDNASLYLVGVADVCVLVSILVIFLS